MTPRALTRRPRRSHKQIPGATKVIRSARRLAIAAMLALTAVAGEVEAESIVQSISPEREIMQIRGIPEFSDARPDADEFTLQIPPYMEPQLTTSAIRLWGLSITDDAAVREFLRDRVLRCFQVAEVDDVAYFDCDAAPQRGAEWVWRAEGLEQWFNLLSWLPELGYAVRECREVDQRRPQEATAGLLSYSCSGREPVRGLVIREPVWRGRPFADPSDSIAVAVDECWRARQPAAPLPDQPLVLDVDLDATGAPIPETIRVLGTPPDTPEGERILDSARQAILQCLNGHHRQVRLQFDPEGGVGLLGGALATVRPRARP